MVLDLRQRATQHWHRRDDTRYEIENSRVNSTATHIKNGGSLCVMNIAWTIIGAKKTDDKLSPFNFVNNYNNLK